jgi:hypothetical protein
VIRVTASLVERNGAEILICDSLPFERDAARLRAEIEDTVSRLCDRGGYTVEEGRCSLVLRIEPVTRISPETTPRLIASR